MEYKHEVMSYDKNGIPFKTHLYVPETDSVTNMEFQEREVHKHVLKVSIMKYNTAGAQQNLPSFHHTQRIGHSVKQGGPESIKAERFQEAFADKVPGLSYPALTGKWKQSVVDAERLLSTFVLAWMERKGYDEEASLVRSCLNWHSASDVRGLSQDERLKCNKQMLDYLLDELMPWHATNRDFSSLEVNKYVRHYYKNHAYSYFRL